MPTVLINAEGVPEALEPNAVPSAVEAGYQVPLVGPQGEYVTAPYAEAQTYLTQGYTQPSSDQLRSLVEQGHYTSTPQKTLTFVEGAMNPLTFGTYGKIASELGLTTPEDILKRQEHNPEVHATGEVAGAVGGVFLTPETTLPGFIARAGQNAAQSLIKAGVPKLVANGVKASIEAGFFTGSHEINEALLGDPQATAEHIAAQVGMSALLGAGTSVALKPLEMLSKSIASRMGVGTGPMVFDTVAGKAVPRGALEAPFDKAAVDIVGETLAEKGIKKGIEAAINKIDEISFAPKDLSLYALAGIGLGKIPETAALYAAGKVANVVKDKLVQVMRQTQNQAAVVAAISHMGGLAQKGMTLIDNHAAGIFGGTYANALDKEGSLPASATLSHEELGIMVKNLTSNPDALFAHVDGKTGAMSSAAPETATQLAGVMTRAIGYLDSQVPQPQKVSPLDAPLPPRQAQMDQFKRQLQVLEKPVETLFSSVKDGSVVVSDMSAVATVYPALFSLMRSSAYSKLVDFLSANDPNELPYKTKLGLSLFLGENLVSGLKPEILMGNQMTLQSAASSNMPQPVKPTSSGMAKISIENEMTSAQAATARRGNRK